MHFHVQFNGLTTKKLRICLLLIPKYIDILWQDLHKHAINKMLNDIPEPEHETEQ